MLEHLPITKASGQFKTNSKAPYQLGNKATLKCDLGYSVPQNNTSTVIFDDNTKQLVWSPPEIHCIPNICDLPPEISNSNWNPIKRHYFPEKFSYVCNDGYEFNQPFSNHYYCGPSGWMPNINVSHIRCVKQQHPVNSDNHCPPIDPKATILMQSGNLATVDCGKGIQVNIKCLQNGNWSKDYPYCDNLIPRIDPIESQPTVVAIPKVKPSLPLNPTNFSPAKTIINPVPPNHTNTSSIKTVVNSVQLHPTNNSPTKQKLSFRQSLESTFMQQPMLLLWCLLSFTFCMWLFYSKI